MPYVRKKTPAHKAGVFCMANNSTYTEGGVHIEVDNDAIYLEVKHIEEMMTTNPALRAKIVQILNEDMLKARNAVVNNMSGIFDNGDPAGARRAVRREVYVQRLGANLNILNMRKYTASWKVRQVERKGTSDPKGRGGNRCKRSFNTIRMHGYEGKARGMILRWVNSGTDGRETRYGARGAITPRYFFSPLASTAINIVSQHIAQVINEEIASQKNNKQ